MAGVVLHRKIIENTVTDGTDQDHLEVLHLSRSVLVGDRTDYLLGLEVPDPAAGMVQVFTMAAAALAVEERRAVAGVPCNTFHAERIFSRFRSALEERQWPGSILHMIGETLEALAAEHPGIRRVGVLSTTGTRNTGVYRDALEQRGYTVCQIPEDDQPLLHEAIYHRQWGLKAVSPPHERAVERVVTCARDVVRQGAEALILGCTELPLAIPEALFEGIPALDPMTVLARSLVHATAPEKLIRLQ